MASYIINSFIGGLADYEDKGVAGAFKNGRNLNIRRKVDSLYCNQALKDETPPVGGFTGRIDWWIPSSDGNIYGFADNGTIYKRTPEGVWTLVYTDTIGAIKGAWEWGLQNGNTYLFWATDTHLNVKQIPGASDWSDVNASIVIGANTYTYPKSDLSSADSHMMLGIGGGIGGLVICNDDTLAFVGYDGSYSDNILQFTPGQTAKALLQRGIEAVIGTNTKNQLYKSALFSWDGNDTQQVFGFDNDQSLPLQSIDAMIDTELPLLVDNKGQVFSSDFISNVPLFVFPDGSTIKPGAVAHDGNLALFGIAGAGSGKTGIYSYGRKIKNGPIVPNLEYQFDCDDIGGLITFGDNLLVSYQTGSGYGVKSIDPDNKAVAVYESLDLKQPVKLGFQRAAKWSTIVVTTAPLPANCSIDVAYKLNKNGNWLTSNLADRTTSFDTADGKEAVFFVGDFAKVEEIQVTLTPNGNSSPEVYSIEPGFD